MTITSQLDASRCCGRSFSVLKMMLIFIGYIITVHSCLHPVCLYLRTHVEYTSLGVSFAAGCMFDSLTVKHLLDRSNNWFVYLLTPWVYVDT